MINSFRLELSQNKQQLGDQFLTCTQRPDLSLYNPASVTHSPQVSWLEQGKNVDQ